MKKYLFSLLLLIFAAMTLTGCGTTDEKTNNNVSGDTGYENNTNDPKENDEAVNEDADLTLDLNVEDGKYLLSLKNISEEDVELTFTSSQQYEYVILDSKGEHLYTYSADKAFAMMMMMETLAPGEELVVELDMEEVFATLESGNYILEAWFVALESEGLKQQIEMSIK